MPGADDHGSGGPSENQETDDIYSGALRRLYRSSPRCARLTENAGGASGGSSPAGFSYQYGSSIEKVGNDFVILVVHLTVRRPGELEQKFSEKVKVTRGHVTEVRPEPRTSVRCYFEPRSEKAGEVGGRP